MTGREGEAVAAPFTMLGGQGVVCEGDVCVVPGLAAEPAPEPGADDR